ncbi:MAG: metalloregulator ArsR/SmtB family transcription factor [Gemmatirosa sp.]|nr:metalloregulator ArsR/SmtB family transcription factor [Gemmatirosa sp.]
MAAPPVLDHLAALADPTRGRLLLALDRHELAVTELASALQLPQSTVSRHLKTLSDAGWVTARNDGASRRYRMAGGLDGSARNLWAVVREPLAAQPSAAVDAGRLRAVLEERRSATRAFFSSTAGRWDRVRADLFGARVDQAAFLALLDPELVVGDLGCGTGAVADALAPYVRRVVAVDDSAAMLAEATRRLDGRANVELREGALEALPVGDGELDAALVVLALHYAPEPDRVLREAVRAVKPGGRVVVVDMLPHDREAYRAEMGHVWLGFESAQIERWLVDAGAETPRVVPLPHDPAVKGPPLFAASARRTPDR